MVVGDCTDLCVYQTAMHLKLHANAHNLKIRIIVPENAVQTHEIPITLARKISTLPHSGGIFHLLFLYHMHLNGIEIVQQIKAS